MNKKEINEIKKNFSDDCGFFTVNRVVTAFVDAEKNIRCVTNRLYNIIEQDESELILQNLKKTLSGRIGANLLEHAFTKDARLEGGSQELMYKTLKGRLEEGEQTDAFLQAIVDRMEYVSTYTIFSAHCTYSVLNKNKAGDFDEEADTDYNFLITAICPVDLRIDGLIYDEALNAIAKKNTSDRIVGLPSDGFLFPLFNDRAADVSGFMYYTKNAKKPNTSIIEDLLGGEFVMTGQSEKEVFHDILVNVVGDELDLDLVTTVNDHIQTLIDQSAHETEVTTVDQNTLNSILWESGVSQDKLQHLPQVYSERLGDKPMTAVNLVDRKTVVSVPSITVNIGKDGVDKVRTQVIDGKRCLIIALDDPEITVNGLELTVDDK